MDYISTHSKIETTKRSVIKSVYLILLYLITPSVLAQVPQQSNIAVKGNSNTVKVIQAGTVITYNLLNELDRQKLLEYVLTIPSIIKQLTTVTRDLRSQRNELKYIQKILIEIARNTSKEGFISLEDYNKGLESYILKNKQLEDELAKLKSQYQNTQFATVLAKAEEKLKQLDSEGYQQILEDFKKQRKAKLQREQQELAQAAYLQASDSYNQFQYEKALQQIEEALQYSNKAGYLLFKGNILMILYRLQEAIDTYELADKLVLNNRLQGAVYNNLGTAYVHKGDYNQAITYHTKALQIDQNILGLEHPSVATTYNNLGTAYNAKGVYDQAIECFTKALQIRQKNLENDHPNTAATYNNLGETYSSKGAYDQAIDYYHKALQISLKVFGPEHPNVATSYISIGTAYDHKGSYDQAIDHLFKGLKIQLKVLGPEHPDVATSYHNLGLAYSNKGDQNKAIDYYTRALQVDQKVFGLESLDVANNYNSIGGAYNYEGENDQAIDYFTKGLQIRLKLLGPGHPFVAVSYNNLGEAYFQKGEPDKAIEYHNKALQIRLKVLGTEHDLVATTYNNLGAAFNNKREYDKSIKYYNEALQIDLKVLGLEHPNIVNIYNNLGTAYNHKGDYEQGIKYYTKALLIGQKILGTEHPSIAATYGNLGAVYRSKGAYDQAIAYFIKALKIRQKVFGKDHAFVQATLLDCGLTLIIAQQIPNAFTYIEQAKDYNELPLSKKIAYFNSTGVGYFKDGNYQLAVDLYMAALYICRQSQLVKTDDLWAIVYQNLAKAYCYMGHKPEATKYFKQALVYSEPLTNNKLKERIKQNAEECEKR